MDSVASGDDPFDWTVDRVVQELCGRGSSWPQSPPDAIWPENISFETALRENEIDGKTLLRWTNRDRLRHDLKIKSLGARETIYWGIQQFQRRSAKFRQTRLQSDSHSSITSPSGSDKDEQFPDALTVSEAYAPNDYERLPLSASHLDAQEVQKAKSSDGHEDSTAEASSEDKKHEILPMQYTLRHGENWSTDSSGLKRRKLDLTLVNADQCEEVPPTPGSRTSDMMELLSPSYHSESSQMAIDEPLQSTRNAKRLAPTLISSTIDVNQRAAKSMPVDNAPRTPSVPSNMTYLGLDGRKRIIPLPFTDWNQKDEDVLNSQQGKIRTTEATHKHTQRLSQKKRAKEGKTLKSGYLGKSRTLIDSIFYGDHVIGEELSDTEEEPETWQVLSTESLSGRRMYVHNVIKRFLRIESMEFSRGDKHFKAKRPYPSRLVSRFHRPSFTLYRVSESGIVRARREAISDWPEVATSIDEGGGGTLGLPGLAQVGSTSLDDQFDTHLLERYGNIESGDEELPLYGESDEDNEYDYDTWKQIEEEIGTQELVYRPSKRPPLTDDEINEAIDEKVNEMVVRWREKIRPKRARKYWRLWLDCRNKGTKGSLIAEKQRHLDRINSDRLVKMRQEICAIRWTGKLQVKQQTASMAQSIADREDLAWCIEVLKSKAPPDKPPPVVVKSRTSERVVETQEIGEDEDILGSKDSSSCSTDSMDDFIDDGDDVEDDFMVNQMEDDMDHDPRSDRASTSSDDSNYGSQNPRNLITEKALASSKNSISSSPNVKRTITEKKANELNGTEDSDETQTPSGFRRSVVDLITLSSDSVEVLGQPQRDTLESIEKPDQPSIKVIDLTAPVKIRVPKPSSSGNKVTRIKLRAKSDLPKSSGRSSRTVASGSESDVASSFNMPKKLPPLSRPLEVSNIPLKVYQRLADKKRLLITVIMTKLTEEVRATLFEVCNSYANGQLFDQILLAAQSLSENRRSRIKGVDDHTLRTMIAIARLFQMWITCQFKRLVEGSSFYDAELQLLKTKDDQFHGFHTLLKNLSIACTSDQKTDHPDYDDEESDEEPISARRRKRKQPESYDDTDANNVMNDNERRTPHKARKRKVLEDKNARGLRELETLRVEEQEHRRQLLRKKLREHGAVESRDKIIINEGKFDQDGFVFVNEQIGQRIKPHQIDGVRFMWQQLTAKGPTTQGCLLAHTMGLGKTMQIITLLVAIAEAVSSPDASVSQQIPEHLRAMRTLVICPPTLLDNWMDELLLWAPTGVLGQLRKIDSSMDRNLRIAYIKEWSSNTGVLLIGYEMFRDLVQNGMNKAGNARFTPDEHAIIKTGLLESASVVIADEAHKMKNADTTIAQIAVLIKTNSRIALTGSPLANNVDEYRSMIDWVAPNYLGPIKEFKAKYAEPIQEGLWYDSTPYERRKCLKLLGVLREDLAPKVHRADMSVLKNDMKPKVEFVLIVPLTPLQEEAYKIYVRCMAEKRTVAGLITVSGKFKQTTLMHWLAILSLLCNHPSCFMTKLLERRDDATHKKGVARAKDVQAIQNDQDMLENLPVWKVGVSQQLIDQETALFGNETSLDHFGLSNKIIILMKILEFSKAVGDKVLVFSSSKPTLNYLEKSCKQAKIAYVRLDGETPMNSRQKMVKDFNGGTAEVMLISSAAGGLGLNLWGANRVIIFDFKHNPVQEEQAVGRAYRIGQKKTVYVYRFVCGGTFEERLHNTAVFKLQLASRVVDNKNPVAWAKRKLSEFLFEPRKVPEEDLSNFKGIDLDVMDKILAQPTARAMIKKIITTETFERNDGETLTAEDQKEVQELVELERLKRSDPVAYQALVQKRQEREQQKKEPQKQANTQTQIHTENANLQSRTSPPPSNFRNRTIIPPFVIGAEKDSMPLATSVGKTNLTDSMGITVDLSVNDVRHPLSISDSDTSGGGEMLITSEQVRARCRGEISKILSDHVGERGNKSNYGLWADAILKQIKSHAEDVDNYKERAVAIQSYLESDQTISRQLLDGTLSPQKLVNDVASLRIVSNISTPIMITRSQLEHLPIASSRPCPSLRTPVVNNKTSIASRRRSYGIPHHDITTTEPSTQKQNPNSLLPVYDQLHHHRTAPTPGTLPTWATNSIRERGDRSAKSSPSRSKQSTSSPVTRNSELFDPKRNGAE